MMRIETETLEQKRRRLYGKKHLNKYLDELNELTNVGVLHKDLLTIPESDLISSEIKKEFGNASVKKYQVKIPFEDKERFLIFIGTLIRLKNGEIYISNEYSKHCGILKLKGLEDFNVNYDFKKVPSEIFSINMKDLSNRLLLDYSEEDGEHYLEIEAYGEDWSKARIED